MEQGIRAGTLLENVLESESGNYSRTGAFQWRTEPAGGMESPLWRPEESAEGNYSQIGAAPWSGNPTEKSSSDRDFLADVIEGRYSNMVSPVSTCERGTRNSIIKVKKRS
jgi:hypothetical protein